MDRGTHDAAARGAAVGLGPSHQTFSGGGTSPPRKALPRADGPLEGRHPTLPAKARERAADARSCGAPAISHFAMDDVLHWDSSRIVHSGMFPNQQKRPMNANVIDTERYATRLKDAGVEDRVANATARARGDELLARTAWAGARSVVRRQRFLWRW